MDVFVDFFLPCFECIWDLVSGILFTQFQPSRTFYNNLKLYLRRKDGLIGKKKLVQIAG